MGRRIVPGTNAAAISGNEPGKIQKSGWWVYIALRSLNSGFPTPPALSLKAAYVLSIIFASITVPPYIPIPSGM